MRIWESKWFGAVWGILGFLMLLSGAASGNVVEMVFGAAVAFGGTSLYLTSYVKSEHRFKKALEVVCAIVALVIIIYGYVITGSFLLGVMTLFIVAIIFIGFLLSYLLPRIRSKFKNRSGDIKDEGKEKGDFEYDVGRELGRDMKKGLEENWKSHVMAGVIAIGCSLPVILLKLPWYITIIAVFIFYQIADYILSKLNQHLDLDKCPDG